MIFFTTFCKLFEFERRECFHLLIYKRPPNADWLFSSSATFQVRSFFEVLFFNSFRYWWRSLPERMHSLAIMTGYSWSVFSIRDLSLPSKFVFLLSIWSDCYSNFNIILYFMTHAATLWYFSRHFVNYLNSSGESVTISSSINVHRTLTGSFRVQPRCRWDRSLKYYFIIRFATDDGLYQKECIL